MSFSKPINHEFMCGMGFKQTVYVSILAYSIGPPEARLYVVRGDGGTDWWACVAKSPERLGDIAHAARFPRRFTTEEEIVQLVMILGYFKPKRKRKTKT